MNYKCVSEWLYLRNITLGAYFLEAPPTWYCLCHQEKVAQSRGWCEIVSDWCVKARHSQGTLTRAAHCVVFLSRRNFCLRGGVEHHDLKLSHLQGEVVQVNGTAKVCYTYIHWVCLGSSNSQWKIELCDRIKVRGLISVVLLLDNYIQYLPSEARKRMYFMWSPKVQHQRIQTPLGTTVFQLDRMC